MTTQDANLSEAAKQLEQPELPMLMRFYASPVQLFSVEYGKVEHITIVVPVGTQVWMDPEPPNGDKQPAADLNSAGRGFTPDA